MMTEAILLILSGILFLYLGAEGLIRGASSIAKKMGVSSLMIGLTVVAIGTSLPETVTSLIAHVKDGESAIALGNIVGSNIANIGLILGLAALIYPVDIAPEVKFREIPILVAVTWIFWYLIRSDLLNIFTGWLLLGIMTFYLGLQIILARSHALGTTEEKKFRAAVEIHLMDRTWVQPIFVLVGCLFLIFGGAVLVQGAVTLAQLLGLSERVIGLTIVAVGTSTPEMAASIIALFRRQHDISIGNVIGSNIFNVVLTIGICAAIYPLDVAKSIKTIDVNVMALFTMLLFFIAVFANKISRVMGLCFLLLYFVYIGSLIV